MVSDKPTIIIYQCVIINLIKMSLTFQRPQIKNKLLSNTDVDYALSTVKSRLKMYIA